MDIDCEEEEITEMTFPLVIIIRQIAMSPSNGIFKFLGIHQADVW